MPRVKRRGPEFRRRDILPEERAILRGESCPQGGNELLFLALDPRGLRKAPDKLREAWDFAREDLLAEWIRERPGTRPFGWWIFDAPRWEDPWPSAFWHSTIPEPRKRVGGTGDPAQECLNLRPAFERGVPVRFLTRPDLHTWPGLVNRTTGAPAAGLDPEDPPTYESQAAYLKRLDLLEPEEADRLAPEDFEPVPVPNPSNTPTEDF